MKCRAFSHFTLHPSPFNLPPLLRELHISNLAVIADARIELAPGLNTFTGATGAGKSLVIGAIGVLLGLRSAGQLLRRGADEGRVAGVFEVKDPKVRRGLEAACDVKLEDDEDLLLTRRLFASGRTSVSLNGSPITLAMLKQVGEALVDVHGQHDHQFLLKPANQLDTLDQYAGLLPLRDEYADAHGELQAARQKLADLTKSEKDRRQRLDFLKFQLAEIDAAEPDASEFEELEARHAILDNLERLKTDSGEAYERLYDADDSVLDQLKTIERTLADLAEIDASVQPPAETLRGAVLALEEAARDLGRYTHKLDLDPGELAEVTERLNTLNRLLKKYGPAMPDLLEHRDNLRKEVAELDRAGQDASDLEAKLKPLGEQVKKLACELSTKRQKAAETLSPLIENQLGELGMAKAQFHVEATASDSFTVTGSDHVEFVAQTNPGLEPQPLRKIASGGELSRIMLALKQVLAKGDRISVLVFDEIDANVGGRLGSIIGNKLRQLAEHHQVLCITHLPQIASYGDRHLTVRKDQSGDATSTTVRAMDGEERLQELAEMIGGAKITDTTLAQARELLETAEAEFATAPKKKPAAPAKKSRGRKAG